MSTYDDASLIYYPSGYKASKAYSLKPTDGSGDLTFTRASSATRVNAAGLIEGVRTNLLLQSNSFDTTWNKNLVTATSGQSGYDGNNDAWKIDLTGAAGNLAVGSLSVGNVGTYSVYAKAGTLNWILLGSQSGNIQAYINLSDGSIGTTGALIIEAKTEDVGGGWYRCSMTYSGTATTARVYPAQANGNLTATSGNIYIQDAQLEQSPSATEYIPTTTTAVSVGMLANVPRIDYTGGGCGKLLLEPQRSNLLLQSEDISSASWTKGNTPAITSNIAIAPDGTTSADGIQSLTGGAYRNINQNFTVASNSTVTSSFFVKKEISETFYGGFSIIFQGGTTKVLYVIVDAVNGTGTISNSTLTGNIKVEDYDNYWRISATTTDNGSNTVCRFTYEATLSTNGTTLNAAAGSVRTIWGFQTELGSYATSYIPTTTTAVTRLADTAFKTGISSLIGQTEGVIFIDFEIQTTGQDMAVMNIYNSSTPANSMYFYLNSSNVLVGYVDNSGTQVTISTGVLAQGRYKAAMAYKANDCVFYLNGSLVGVDVSNTIPTCNDLRLENYAGVPTYQEKTAVNQALLFTTRLTNTQLAQLTTI